MVRLVVQDENRWFYWDLPFAQEFMNLEEKPPLTHDMHMKSFIIAGSFIRVYLAIKQTKLIWRLIFGQIKLLLLITHIKKKKKEKRKGFKCILEMGIGQQRWTVLGVFTIINREWDSFCFFLFGHSSNQYCRIEILWRRKWLCWLCFFAFSVALAQASAD